MHRTTDFFGKVTVVKLHDNILIYFLEHLFFYLLFKKTKRDPIQCSNGGIYPQNLSLFR
jgi:hypothetical protein